MAGFLNAYSIQTWLESCPQAYLEGTEYGHKPGVKEFKEGYEHLANRSLLAFKKRLLEFVAAKDWEASVFAQNVILESMEFAAFHSHMKRADPRTAEILSGILKDERRHMGFGENDLGRHLTSTPHARTRLAEIKKELDSLVLGTFEESLRDLGVAVAERPEVRRLYLETVRRLGFDFMTDPLLEAAEESTEAQAPRKRYLLADDTGFDEVPKKYRRFYRRWGGGGDVLARNEVLCPVCKVVIRSNRELRAGDRVYCMPCMSRLIVVESGSGRLEATVSY